MRSSLLQLLFLAGCTTTASQAPVGLDSAVVRPTPAVQEWTVLEGARTVGSVVRYQEALPPHRHLFAVRNLYDQDLGLVDSSGRAWRLRPHAEAELLGTGTVAEGAARILGSERVTLLERPPQHP